MVPVRSSSTTTPSAKRELYQFCFVRNCHRLLGKAHRQLNAKSLGKEEEPAITGLLVKEMNSLIEDEKAPSWMRNLVALDDPPQNSPTRLGKARRRIDIEFVLVQRGRRPRFHFEAKRLYRSDSVSEYLGPKGLVLFVNGEYAAEEDAGGMVGYVQTELPKVWLQKIEAALDGARRSLCIPQGTGFESVRLAPELDPVHVSHHNRRSVGRQIQIYHTLLLFC